MGLAVQVGMLADLLKMDEEGAQWIRESLQKVNEVLAENNLPLHNEPEEIPPLDDRSILESFPYSFLHYLRRAYAHWKQIPSIKITPCRDDEDPSSDPVVDKESSMFESHLLCHSDCEGFYLPIDFPDVLIDEKDQDRIEGGLLGSSHQLAIELKAMAPAIGVHLVDGELMDDIIDAIRSDIENKSDLWIERGVWLTLYEAARLSIQYKTAIFFT